MPRGPARSHRPSRPAAPIAARVSAAPPVVLTADALTSMGLAAGGSSDSSSIACTTVTASSSACVTARERQPPGGSIASVHGGATSTLSSEVPAGRRIEAV